MGVLQRLSRLMTGGTEAVAELDAGEALTQCYVDCVRRAHLLSRHAEMAPPGYGTDGLKELAAAEAQQVEQWRNALRAAGVTPPTVADDDLPPGAPNHWARLVQNLQLHRASARRLRELAVHFAESLPATAALFDQLCAEESMHAERLRTLIARADPQALN
jgi:hypothetical protein